MDRWMQSLKWASVGLAVAYLFLACLTRDGRSIIVMLTVVGIALAFIWRSEEIGDYTGFAGHGYVTSTTPGCLISAVGWVILIGIGWLLFRVR